MPSSSLRVRPVLISLWIVAAAILSGCPATTQRNVLWNTVTACIDVGTPGYCTQCLTPRIEAPCAQGRGCRETTAVWEETADYVAIRDRKMCGCPEGFVHGLAIPRARVTGVEDPHRPDGIWAFAWAGARKRINDESAIALAVNPKGSRGQDQLHVHIVRLTSDARDRFDAARLARVPSLASVWTAAAKIADAVHAKDYGVLVARRREGGFLVLVTEHSPEKSFTRYQCR